MEIELANRISIERNNRLAFWGYVLYASVIVTCTFTLFYPVIERFFGHNINCIFRTLTHLPCPTCGYSRAINRVLEGNLWISLLYNPIWIVLVIYQIFLIIISIRSIILSKALFIQDKWIFVFIGLLVINWILKFIIGTEYY